MTLIGKTMLRLKDLLAEFRGEVPTSKLVRRGLVVGKNFNRQKWCIIDGSHCWLITIGDNVTLAPRVHILAHDASTKFFLGYSKIGNVTIGDMVFIGAGSIILPGVKIGNRSIIGAGSVVAKDIPEGSVAAGNPAKVISSINDYLAKNKKLMQDRPVYDEQWTDRNNISNQQKLQMKQSLANGCGYVK